MSHEIRTPMNGIIGFLELLREPDLSEENKNNYIDIVTQSSRRLLDTINDIIEISKIEAGEMKMFPSVILLQELMAYYHGFFRQQTDQKGLNYIISNKLQGRLAAFRTDRNKLDSIITNLIKNAIKFTARGSIEFGCDLEGDMLCFYVKDTGSGIPKDKLDLIFERFVQADTTSSRTQEGAGLGLAIVKAYTQMLGGCVTVRSEIGKGSIFTVSIPFTRVEENMNDLNAQSTADYPDKEFKATILIAEDDFPSYMYLEKLLSGRGISFVHAKTGIDTIRFARENPEISLILMDIRMPGMSGLEATAEIRTFNKTIPIIAQTAYSLTGDREKALEAGCTDYISKPVKAHELYRLINKYLGSSGPDYKIPNL
jgi:CheY-like chemotaxis protein